MPGSPGRIALTTAVLARRVAAFSIEMKLPLAIFVAFATVTLSSACPRRSGWAG